MMMHLFRSRGWGEAYCNLLLTVCCASIFLNEVPTGLLADKYGYKKSLIAAMFLLASGRAIYAFSTSYVLSVIGQVVEGAGHACNSGSIDALLFTMCRNTAGPGSNPEVTRRMYQKESSTLEMLGGFWGFGSCIFASLVGLVLGFEWLHTHCLVFYGVQIVGYLIAMAVFTQLPDVEVQVEESEDSSVFELPKLLSSKAKLLIVQSGMWSGIMYICKYQMAGAFLDHRGVPESWIWLVYSVADSIAGYLVREYGTSRWMTGASNMWTFLVLAVLISLGIGFAFESKSEWGIPAVLVMGAVLSGSHTVALLQLKSRLQLVVEDEFRATALNLCSSFAVVHQQAGTLALNGVVGTWGYGLVSYSAMLLGYFGCTMILRSLACTAPAGKVRTAPRNGAKKLD